MKLKKIIVLSITVCLLSVILTIPSFAIVIESNGDGYSLYNGARLPSLPVVNMDTYPYVVVAATDSFNDVFDPHILYFFNSNSFYHDPSSENELTFYDDTEYVYYYYDTRHLDWTGRIVGSFSAGDGMIQNVNCVWSNTDILYDDDTIYLAASDPIPLDGMQVITWDGDTTDLTAVGNKYTVADYANASNALAVMTTDGALTVSTNFGNSDGVWTVVGADGTTGYAFANPSEGIGAFKYSDNQYTSLIAYREGETPPEESQPPSGGEGESTGGITSAELEASQAAQTAEIVAKVESESTIIQAAISSLENALSNSTILDYLKQPLTFRDFDFETGELSTTSQTYEGIVPLFGHFAQNVEQYLGELVDVRANEQQEELKEETRGFWDIIIGFFKPNADGDDASVSVDGVGTVVDIVNTIAKMLNPSGSAATDIVDVLTADQSWSLFTDEASSSFDSTVSTYSVRTNDTDFSVSDYHEQYRQSYLNR